VVCAPFAKYSLLTRMQIAIHLSLAVAYMHSASPPMIHRDIKPSNVLVSGNGASVVAKLADLGLCVVQSPGLHDRAGTPSYMSPEIYAGTPYTTKTDIFSLGVTLCEIIVGEPLTYVDSYHAYMRWLVTEKRAVPVDPRLSGVSPKLHDLVVRMVDLVPDRRPDIEQVLTALNEVNSGVTVPCARGLRFWEAGDLGAQSSWPAFANRAIDVILLARKVRQEEYAEIANNMRAVRCMLAEDDIVTRQRWGEFVTAFGPMGKYKENQGALEQLIREAAAVSRQNCFYPNISKADAEAILRDGFFIVRMSGSDRGVLVFSARMSTGVQHHRVERPHEVPNPYAFPTLKITTNTLVRLMEQYGRHLGLQPLKRKPVDEDAELYVKPRGARK
jgi:hypothetical protein